MQSVLGFMMIEKKKKNFQEYYSEPRYISKVNNGGYDSEYSSDSENGDVEGLMKSCIKQLSGKQKNQLALLEHQYPKIYEYLKSDVVKKNLDVLDSIKQLYYDQIHYRYPEMIRVQRGVVEIPLLKCCLMNQSIRVEAN
jgi:hypothetical protein